MTSPLQTRLDKAEVSLAETEARLQQALELIEIMKSEICNCAEIFDAYALMHFMKETEEGNAEGNTNLSHAAQIREVLSAHKEFMDGEKEVR